LSEGIRKDMRNPSLRSGKDGQFKTEYYRNHRSRSMHEQNGVIEDEIEMDHQGRT
jgi:hypothetical protein